MGMPGGFELLAILVIVVLLFGGKKIPELMSGIGKGIKNFKNAMKDDESVASENQEKLTQQATAKAQEAQPQEKKS